MGVVNGQPPAPAAEVYATPARGGGDNRARNGGDPVDRARQKEIELGSSEAELRALFAAMDDIILVLDASPSARLSE